MSKTKKLAQISLFIALVCVSTLAIKIPIPAVNGYVHFGDAFIILSSVFLGPVYGALAGGLGSAMADLLSGYAIYALPTFIIKALMALGAGYIYSKLSKCINNMFIRLILCGIYATAIVIGGYFVFEYFMYGDAAIASILPNLSQGISAVIISSVLLPIFNKLRLHDDK